MRDFRKPILSAWPMARPLSRSSSRWTSMRWERLPQVTWWLRTSSRYSDLHEGLQEANLERLADGEAVEPFEQPLDFNALGEVAAGDVVAEDFLAVFRSA